MQNEIEFDHIFALAWMWDTQDVTCPPHPHQQKQFPSPMANKNKPCTDIHEGYTKESNEQETQ